MQSYSRSKHTWRSNRTGSSAARPCTTFPFFFTPQPTCPQLCCIYQSSYTLLMFDRTPPPGQPSDARFLLFHICLFPESYTQGTKKNNINVNCTKMLEKRIRIVHRAELNLFDKNKLDKHYLPVFTLLEIKQVESRRVCIISNNGTPCST